jgi:hypothetical protein
VKSLRPDASACEGLACGIDFYSLDADCLCCSSETTTRTNRPGSVFDETYCCAGLSFGTLYGAYSMCAVGNSGSAAACTLKTYEVDAERVFCPTGVNVVNSDYWTAYYCPGLPAGSLCGSNDMCSCMLHWRRISVNVGCVYYQNPFGTCFYDYTLLTVVALSFLPAL